MENIIEMMFEDTQLLIPRLFIFIKPKTEARKIIDRIKSEKKILIKAYPNVGEFGECLRVSIGEKKYMEQFTSALEKIDK